MSNLSATAVSYSIKNLRRGGNSKVHNLVALTFGNTSATYSTGGIALSGASMGCPNTIESLIVASQYSSASGYFMLFDPNTSKLKLFRNGSSPNAAAFVEATGDAPAPETVDVEVTGW